MMLSDPAGGVRESPHRASSSVVSPGSGRGSPIRRVGKAHEAINKNFREQIEGANRNVREQIKGVNQNNRDQIEGINRNNRDQIEGVNRNNRDQIEGVNRNIDRIYQLLSALIGRGKGVDVGP